MKEKKVLWLSDSTRWQGYWWFRDTTGACFAGVIGGFESIELLVNRFGKKPAIVLVAATECSVVEAKLPDNSKEALKTIPYQLEENLLSDIADVVFTPLPVMEKSKLTNDKSVQVMVCSKAFLTDWQNHLSNTPMQVCQLLPDYLAMKSIESGSHFLRWNEHYYFRGEKNGIYPAEHFNSVEGLFTDCCEFHPNEKVSSLPDISVDEGVPIPFIYLAESVPENSQLSFPVGLAGKVKFNTLFTPIRLIMVCCILLMTNLLVAGWQFSETKAATEQNAEALSEQFYHWMPENARMVDPPHQLQLLLETRTGLLTSSPLFSLLRPFNEVAERLGITVKTIQYSLEGSQLRISTHTISQELRESVSAQLSSQSILSEWIGNDLYLRRMEGV